MNDIQLKADNPTQKWNNGLGTRPFKNKNILTVIYNPKNTTKSKKNT